MPNSQLTAMFLFPIIRLTRNISPGLAITAIISVVYFSNSDLTAEDAGQIIDQKGACQSNMGLIEFATSGGDYLN